MTKTDHFFSKVLLFCIPLYFTQGYFFGSGSFISQLLVGLWLIIDLIYTGRYLYKSEKDAIGNSLLVFWAINLIYWLFSPKEVYMSSLVFDTFGVFKNTTIVVLTYFPYKYWVCSNEPISERYFKCFAVFLIAAAIVAFFTFAASNFAIYDTIVTNNSAYYFIVALPFLGYFFEKKMIYLLFGVLAVFILLCAKRGSILCFVLSMAVFAVSYLNTVSKKKTISALILLFVAAGVVAALAVSIYGQNELLREKFEMTVDGNASERDIIYYQLWSIFKTSTLWQQLFGHGLSQTVSLIGGYAHNDWLELLICEGLLGAISYFIFFVNTFKYYKRHRYQMAHRDKYIYITAVGCLLLRTMFSMGYISPESAMFCIGIAAGQRTNNVEI